MSPRALGRGAERRFLLAVAPDEGEPELAPEDVPHALRVLRLAPGDRLLGLDGRGAAWPLRVTRVERAKLRLERDGEPRREPAAGEPGAPRAFLELVVALPRGERAEAMATRLSELGASRLVPWVVERSPSAERELSPARRRRLERALAEATKQCGRLWLPELGAVLRGLPSAPPVHAHERTPRGAPEARASATAVLDPRSGEGFLGWAGEQARLGTRRLRVFVGPEGGLSPEEGQGLRELGALPLALARETLRIETAAEAAAALVEASWLEHAGAQERGQPR